MASRRAPADENLTVGFFVGGVGPIVVAALLVPLREELHHTNLALILVVVVVLAAVVGGRAPGALAAVVAAMSYDYFLTRPYLTLQIDNADDIETTIILLAIGLIVGEVVHLARRARRAAASDAAAIERLRRVADQAARCSADDLTLTVEAELTDLLGLVECHFERPPFPGPVLPVLERTGAVTGVAHRHFHHGGLTLPEGGVELPVVGDGQPIARFVLGADPERGVLREERVVAVAMADQLGAVLAAGDLAHTRPEDNHG